MEGSSCINHIFHLICAVGLQLGGNINRQGANKIGTSSGVQNMPEMPTSAAYSKNVSKIKTGPIFWRRTRYFCALFEKVVSFEL